MIQKVSARGVLMYCGKCGKPIYDGDGFCIACGSKVRANITVPPQNGNDAPLKTLPKKQKENLVYRWGIPCFYLLQAILFFTAGYLNFPQITADSIFSSDIKHVSLSLADILLNADKFGINETFAGFLWVMIILTFIASLLLFLPKKMFSIKRNSLIIAICVSILTIALHIGLVLNLQSIREAYGGLAGFFMDMADIRLVSGFYSCIIIAVMQIIFTAFSLLQLYKVNADPYGKETCAKVGGTSKNNIIRVDIVKIRDKYIRAAFLQLRKLPKRVYVIISVSVVFSISIWILISGGVFSYERGKIVNGIMHTDSNWTYYNIWEDGIYKKSHDNSEIFRITDIHRSAGTSFFIDDWLYYEAFENPSYIAVYKVRSDGTDKTQLIEGNVRLLQVSDNWVYYADFIDDYGKNENCILSRIRTDGTGNETIIPLSFVGDIQLVDEWVYYVGAYSSLWRVRIDGTNDTRLNEMNWINIIQIIDDWVYYRSNGIYKIRTDGTGDTRIIDDEDFRFANSILGINDGWVYYRKGNSVYRIRTDGTDDIKFLNSRVHALLFFDDWVYYYKAGIVDRWFMIHADGSGNQAVFG